MMRRSRFGIGAGFALALAGMMGGAQASQPVLAQTTQSQDLKATREYKKDKRAINVNLSGGLDFPPYASDFGLSPKEYGMRYGHGNKSGRNNRLRFSHNAKLKRRRAA